jgi:hypothetical protein
MHVPSPSRSASWFPPGTRLLAAAVLVTAAALLPAACAGTGAPRDPQEVERRFYEGRCGVCHVPFKPTDYPPAKWPGIVAKMGPRAGLSAAQRERVLRYLTADDPAVADAASR